MLPICLVVGFATRFTALALIVMTGLVAVYVTPEALWTMHAYWIAILLVLMTLGLAPSRSTRSSARSTRSNDACVPGLAWLADDRACMNFASDNTAGIAPEILSAIAQANSGFALAYGADDWTKSVEARFAEVFEHDVRGISGGDRYGGQFAGARAPCPAMGRGALPCRGAYHHR